MKSLTHNKKILHNNTISRAVKSVFSIITTSAMQRSLRSPLFPALNSAARTCLYSTGSTSSTHSSSPTISANIDTFSRTNVRKSILPEAELKLTVKKMHEKINGRDPDVKDFHNLVPIKQIMEAYRTCKSMKIKADASELIHSILTILRARNSVLKPLISHVRRQVIREQNVTLCSYLEEIVDDLVNNRSHASTSAIVYLITAFDSMENNTQGSVAWKRLNEVSSSIEGLSEKLNDPKVISVALKFVDPDIITIDELESTYRNSLSQHGHAIATDEALILGYLRFQQFEKAVELYSDVVDKYDVVKSDSIISRIHNTILSKCEDYTISESFFKSAVSNMSMLQLHPSAAAHFIKVTFASTNDVKRTVDAYIQALEKINTQTRVTPGINRMNMLSEVLKPIIVGKYSDAGPVEEVQEFINQVIDNSNGIPEHLVLNHVLSMVSKSWPSADYITVLQKRLQDYGTLQFDSLRVLLTSCYGLSSQQISLDAVITWWNRLTQIKRLDILDWVSLAKACNEPSRVSFFISQIEEYKPDMQKLSVSKMTVISDGLKTLGYDVDNLATAVKFSVADVDAELSARFKSNSMTV